MAKTASTPVPAASTFAKKLKAANANWAAAKERAASSAGGIPEFDDGRYIAQLVDAKIGESQAGRMQVVFKFVFQDTPYEGQHKLDFQGIETEQNLEFLAKRLSQLGYELPDDLPGIADILTDINESKPLCKIHLKTKGDYQNVYLDKVLGESADEDEDATEDGDETEAEETVEEEEEAPAPPPAKKSKKTAAPPPPAEEEEEAEDEEAGEEEADDDDAVELTAGMTVEAETSKGTVTGKVLAILEAEGKVRIQPDNGGAVLRVALDKVSVVEDAPEEPPAKKSKKR
jgi:hypothetical protein